MLDRVLRLGLVGLVCVPSVLGVPGLCAGTVLALEGTGADPPLSPALQELLKETRKEHTLRAVELLYAIFCLDMQQLTLTLLGHILPNLLTDSSKWHTLMDPPGKALAK